MSDDEALRRLISADLAANAAGEPQNTISAVRANKQRRDRWRVLVVVAALIGTLVALSAGYVLAARVLPPFGGSVATSLLWLPLVAIGALVAAAVWLAVSALIDPRR